MMFALKQVAAEYYLQSGDGREGNYIQNLPFQSARLLNILASRYGIINPKQKDTKMDRRRVALCHTLFYFIILS